MHILINSQGCPHSTAMISVFQGRTLSDKTKYSASKANVTERLESANLNSLDNSTTATVSTGAHSNTTGTHGCVSIGVQVGVPSVTSLGPGTSNRWIMRQKCGAQVFLSESMPATSGW